MEISQIEPYINDFLKGVYKSFYNTKRPIIKSKHEHACKVCGSHPVNSVRREKVICRTCGTSYRPAVKSKSRNAYTGKVLLDLRGKI